MTTKHNDANITWSSTHIVCLQGLQFLMNNQTGIKMFATGTHSTHQEHDIDDIHTVTFYVQDSTNHHKKVFRVSFCFLAILLDKDCPNKELQTFRVFWTLYLAFYSYCQKKWIQQPKFKFWMRLFTFYSC